jgi:regulator of protease activity HflC (stomatin/prohibitin superfamily)
VKVFHVDLRKRVMDVAGQEIMTADEVALRFNALVCYRVADVFKSVSVVDDSTQAIYRL